MTSFTYGFLASKENTWPKIVGQQTGLEVYNVSMGGWGPSQYFCAMKVYALKLKPKFIVFGVYLGNDIGQAATENFPCDELDPDRIAAGSEIWEFADAGPLRGLRTWLAQHSVLYQLIKTRLSASTWFVKIADAGNPDILIDSSTGKTVVLRVEPWESCNLGNDRKPHQFDWTACDAQFQRGTAITIKRLADIETECEHIGAICFTILIPSKEATYFPLLPSSVPLQMAGELEHLRRNEQFAGNAIAAAFAHTGMVVVQCRARFAQHDPRRKFDISRQ